MGKRDIEIRKDDIIDIDDIGKQRKSGKEKIRKNDFLHRNDSLGEFLNGTIGEEKTDKPVKIPDYVYKNLPEAKTQWEALQKWIIKKDVNIIIDEIYKEIAEVLDTEPEPEIGYNGKIEQPGELHDSQDPFSHDILKFQGRLAQLYYDIHRTAIIYAFDREEEKREGQIKNEIKQEFEKSFKMQAETLKQLKLRNEKLEADNTELQRQLNNEKDIKLTETQNQVNYIEKQERDHYNRDLEAKEKLIKKRGEQIKVLEEWLTWKQRHYWRKYKIERWNEDIQEKLRVTTVK